MPGNVYLGVGPVLRSSRARPMMTLVESGEDAARVRELVEHAWHACMAMQAILNATPQETRLHLNGAPVG